MDRVEQELAKPAYRTFFALMTKRAVLVISIFGIIVFSNALFNAFVYDDQPQIVQNPYVQSIRNIPLWFSSGMTKADATGFRILDAHYRPIQLSVYTVIASIFGKTPFFFHLFQISLHVVNALLVFLIFSSFFLRPTSLILALVFLVHPINSEAAIYIANLQETLFLFFGLSALLTLVKAREAQMTVKRSALVAFLLFLSLMSKETGALFYPVIIMYALMFSKKNLIRILVGSLCAFGAYVLLRYYSTTHELLVGISSLVQQSSFTERLLSIPQIIFYYFSKLFYPVNFSIGQEWLVHQRSLTDFYWPLFVDVVLLAGLVLLGAYVYKKKKEAFKLYMFFGFWLLIGLGLHLQLIPLDQTVADRWFYFPIIGFLGIAGILWKFVGVPKLGKNMYLIGASLLVLLLSVLTMVRNSQWKTPEKLYSHDLQYSRVSPQIDNLYGVLLLQEGRLDEAKPYLERSVQANRLIGSNLQNLGAWHQMSGNLQEAKRFYWEDINLDNSLPKSYSYINLARLALYDENEPEEALKLTSAGLSRYPRNELLLGYSALASYGVGNRDEALATAELLFNLYPSQDNEGLRDYIKYNPIDENP